MGSVVEANDIIPTTLFAPKRPVTIANDAMQIATINKDGLNGYNKDTNCIKCSKQSFSLLLL